MSAGTEANSSASPYVWKYPSVYMGLLMYRYGPGGSGGMGSSGAKKLCQ